MGPLTLGRRSRVPPCHTRGGRAKKLPGGTRSWRGPALSARGKLRATTPLLVPTMGQPGNLLGGEVGRAGGQHAAFGPRATGNSIHSPCHPSSSRRLSWEEGMDPSSAAPSAERPPPPLNVSGVGLIPTIGGLKKEGIGGESLVGPLSPAGFGCQ